MLKNIGKIGIILTIIALIIQMIFLGKEIHSINQFKNNYIKTIKKQNLQSVCPKTHKNCAIDGAKNRAHNNIQIVIKKHIHLFLIVLLGYLCFWSMIIYEKHKKRSITIIIFSIILLFILGYLFHFFSFYHFYDYD